MDTEIRPEPTDAERRAILTAIDAGAELPSPYRSRWRDAALEDLGGGDPSAEEAWSDAGVVEP